MRWVVGLDLRPESQGAIHFGVWLAKRMHETPQQSLIGVHVVEQESTFPILRYHAEEEVQMGATTAAKRAVEEAMAGDWMGEPHVVLGATADERLAAALPLYQADGLIVGRQAKAGQDLIQRLGRVARRLLRKLPVPVIVVPPDLLESSVGDGPVIMATDLGDDAVSAARFARKVATRISKPLVVAHVVPMPDDVGVVAYVPDFSWEKVRSDWHDSAVAQLVAWTEEHEIEADRRVVEAGITVTRLVDLARREDASMIVCGSRSLNMLERVFSSSIGAEVGAAATVPVCVVPSGWVAADEPVDSE
jgi:nucleotide-binding universal stress UspA family protein